MGTGTFLGKGTCPQIQTYGFIPMNLPPSFNFFETIHAADERISVDSVEFGAKAIFELMSRFGEAF